MLSIERAKELLNDPSLTDKEVEDMRDGMYELINIVFEKWKEEQTLGTEKEINEINITYDNRKQK